MDDNEINQVADGDTYREWRGRMGLSHAKAAEALGICRRTSLNYQLRDSKTFPIGTSRLCNLLEQNKLLGLE